MVLRRSTLTLFCAVVLVSTLYVEGASHAERKFPLPKAALEATPDQPWTGMQWIDDPESAVTAEAFAADISKILYINRCVGGCKITPGVNDSRNNTSTVPKEVSILSEFGWSNEAWDETIACVRDVYSPYNVTIVTEDPGEAFHHEAILAGTPKEMNLGEGVGGIAPSGCSPLNNVISFSFANSMFTKNGNVLEMCWIVAQESAHSFGLASHLFDCQDPMTYIPGCGRKYFHNRNMPCGETSIQDCNCGSKTLNSHSELLSVFGEGTLPPPPALEIVSPAADAKVVDNSSVFWEATDPRMVSHSEFWVNGTNYGTVPGHDYVNRNSPYSAGLPDLPDGYIDIEIRSFTDIGSVATQTIRVLKGSPCTSADSCFPGQSCEAGRCEFQKNQVLGGECIDTAQCGEGVCGEVSGRGQCALACDLGVQDACDPGFDCIANEAEGADRGVCWNESTGGCCSVAGTKRDPMPWFGGGLFFIAVLLSRRRRA